MAYDTQRHTATQAHSAAAAHEVDAGLRAYMLRVYNYMASGLMLSGIVAVVTLYTPMITLFYNISPSGQVLGFNMLGIVASFAPLGILLIAMFAQNKMSATATQALYWGFTALMGVGLSILLVRYTGASVVRVFFITAAAFAALSLYGYTTKKDLSAFGKFLFMGLIGIIIAAVVNIFLQSPMMQFVISAIGVLVFAGLIAFDTQRIKNEYYESLGHDDVQTRMAVWSALALYLNFINLMQFLLYFLGERE